jgi:hypothetical protein
VASDFVYNWNSREALTSIAYDYLLGQVMTISRLTKSLEMPSFSTSLTF